MKPWELFDLIFDDDSVEHLWQHGIKEYEVREIFADDHAWFRDGRLEPEDWYMIGRTRAGRALTIIVTVLPSGHLRPFTGWGPTQAEARRLPRRR